MAEHDAVFGLAGGLVNNLNDGMSWGVFPLLFIANGVTLEGVGWIKAVYPVIWGVGQIFTGTLADRVGRKRLIVWGMCTSMPTTRCETAVPGRSRTW